MCRHLAYLGPPVLLASLLYDPPQSLLRQSWSPRHQRHGTINADGYGVGWYQPDVRPEPARFRRAGPMWADPSLESLARVVRAGAFLGSVRSATPPAPIEESGAAPFTEGRWLFSLNGRVAGDVGAVRRQVAPRRQAGIQGASDSEVLFALLLDRIDAGSLPAEALAGLIAAVPGRLNLLLTDGDTAWATASGDSLWWRAGRDQVAPSVVVASEPLDDDPGWAPVPDGSLLTATAAVPCSIVPLPTKEASAHEGVPAP
ncbi:MAG: ergothioneine biosynthesis protein EgtC [Actinomycetota bacterium]|nr:ergothioneine biosynthesis protein EgtC [Actinomycetota bacterium]